MTTPLPTAAGVWTPPESADPEVAAEWALLARALAEQEEPLPAVTTNELAREWGRATYRVVFTDRPADIPADIPADHAYAPVWDAVLTVRAGVAPEDLYRVGHALAEVHGIEGAASPAGAASNLRMTVQARFWQHTLRSVVGWLLAEQALKRDIGAHTHDHWREYVSVGLEEDGWLYAAAGLTADEALAQHAAAALGEEHLRLMAALRGVHLPVG